MISAHVRNPLVEAAPLQDETILLNPDKNQFCVLNRTASFIWNKLTVASTTDALAAAICSSFSGVAMEVAFADTDRTLEELLSLKFVISRAEELGNEPDGKKTPIAIPMAPPGPDLPTYECPRLTLMNEDEVLSAFQVPVVATTWWG